MTSARTTAWRGQGLRVTLLASGSAANATLIEHGDTAVLIDAGVPWRQLVARLHSVGRSPDTLSAVVITHHHTDHVSSLASLLRAVPTLPVFLTPGTLSSLTDVRTGPPRASAEAFDPFADAPPEEESVSADPLHPSDEGLVSGGAADDASDVSASGAPETGADAATDDQLPQLSLDAIPPARRALVRRLVTAHVTVVLPGNAWTVGELLLRTARLPHDAPDTLGIRCEVVGQPALAMAQVTDLGSLTGDVMDLVRHVGLLVVETNHDPDMLRRAHYPLPLKERIRSDLGHLANAQGAALAASVAHPGLEWVIGAHLSSDTNTAAEAGRRLTQALRGTPFQGRVRIAWPDRVSGPWVLSAPARVPRHWVPRE